MYYIYIYLGITYIYIYNIMYYIYNGINLKWFAMVCHGLPLGQRCIARGFPADICCGHKPSAVRGNPEVLAPERAFLETNRAV